MLALAILALAQPDPLIELQKGEIPIIISAPHGGRQAIPDCPLRTNTNAPQFVTVLDTNSDKLAQETAKQLEHLIGKKPWVIVAKFSRKYVDANRPEADGTESEAGKTVYQRYHRALQEAVTACRVIPRALLLDIHAQGKSADVIYRGTANLQTVKVAEVAPFLNRLETNKLKLFPAISSPAEKENPSFNGGFITRHYGKQNPSGVNAIQLEVGASFRNNEGLANTAQQIAEAIAFHLKDQ